MIRKFKLDASSDALGLSCLVSEPEPEVKKLGAIVLVHGMCEHKERYAGLMNFLSGAGYVCTISDLRGHGESVLDEEDLGFMYKGGWKAMVEDVNSLVRWTRENYPGLPLNLFGHSMGSLVVRSFTKRHDEAIDRLIVCGCPSDNPAKGAGRLLAGTIGLLRGWHFRSALLQTMSFGAYNKPFKDEGYESAWVCSDRNVLEAYHSDPLCQYVFTANGFYNLMGLMQDCYSPKGWKMSHTDLPVLFISGAEDPCRISDKALEKAVATMKNAGYRNATLKIYPGMRHEIHNETAAPKTVWADILDFIKK